MVGKLIAMFIDLFRLHKLKMVSVVFSALIFAVFLFRYDDLSEVVSTMVSENTQNQVFLQFDELGFQLFPYPALAVENVVVDSSFMPSLQARHLSLAPSVTGFLSFRPGFNAGIRDVWKGDVDIELKTGKKNAQGATQQLIRLDIEKIDLAKVNETLDLPLKLQGSLSGDSNLALDPSFAVQPEGDLILRVKELRFPASTIPIPGWGAVAIPGMSWANITLKGKLKDGKLLIEQADLGSNTDALNAIVRGEVDMRFLAQENSQATLVWGGYQMSVDLNIHKKLDKDFGIVNGFIGQYRTATSTGSRYRFRVSAAQVAAPPALTREN